jgi:hypothetical protein
VAYNVANCANRKIEDQSNDQKNGIIESYVMQRAYEMFVWHAGREVLRGLEPIRHVNMESNIMNSFSNYINQAIQSRYGVVDICTG